MLEVHVQKQLGAFHLNVNFACENEVLGLLGTSGCGKTMTLRMIAGLVQPDRGSVILNGRTLFDSEKKINLPPQQRHTGYFFQQYALFPHMTVAENIEAGLRHLPRAERAAAVKKQIQAFRLEGLEKHHPKQLSGGQQQRTALARMLAGDPEILLLDEPFSALDGALKWQLELDMMETLRDFKGDVLFVSHDRDEISHLCAEVCVIFDGKSEHKQTVEQLMETPQTLAAAQLAGCRNFSRASLLPSGELECSDWRALLKPGASVPKNLEYAGIRAEDLRIAAEGEEGIHTRLTKLIYDRGQSMALLECSSGSLLCMVISKEQAAALTPGQKLTVCAAAEKILYLHS